MNAILEIQRISSLKPTEQKTRTKTPDKPKSRRERRKADREKLRQLKLSALGNANIDKTGSNKK